MPYTDTKQMLLDAQKGGYAVGAFNTENMEMTQAIIAAAEELRAPVILQTTPSTLRYGSPDVFCAMVKALADGASVPVALHLDHGESFELAEAAMNAGYSSIMIDGSHESFEENIKKTSAVTALSSGKTPIEAELGKVGGKEDDLDGGEGGYTDPIEAKEFVQRTGVDSLAVGIGTAHGVYATTPRLDKDRLVLIGEQVDIPLVLHGASGLSDEDLTDCIKRGICKINFATELRMAYTKGVKEYIDSDPKVFDPKKYGTCGRNEVKKLVMEKITVCGSAGKA